MAAKEERIATPPTFLIVFDERFAEEVEKFKQRPYKTFVGELFAKLASYFSAVNALNKKLLSLKPDQSIPVNLGGRPLMLSRADVPKISGLYKASLAIAKKYIRTKKKTAGRKVSPETEHKSVFARLLAGSAMTDYLKQAFAADEFNGVRAGTWRNLEQGYMLKLTAMNLWYILGYVATIKAWQGRAIPSAAEAKAAAANMSVDQLAAAKAAFSGEAFVPSQTLLQSFGAFPAVYTMGLVAGKAGKVINNTGQNLWQILQAQGGFDGQRVKLNSINRIISLTMYSKAEDLPADGSLGQAWAYLTNPATSPSLIGEKNAVAAHRGAIKEASKDLKKRLEAARKQFKNRHDELTKPKKA